MNQIHLGDPSLHLSPIVIESGIELQKLFRELSESFERTENKLIDIRNKIDTLPIPPVNQLRYAGYHITQALSSLNIEKFPTQISRRHVTSVHKHCLRGYYDAFDAAAIIIKKRFEGLVTEYRLALISIYTEFPQAANLKVALEDLSKVSKIKEENFIEGVVQKKLTREEYYNLIDKKLEAVFELYGLIPVMENHLTIKIAEQVELNKKQKVIDKKNMKIAFWTLFIGLAATFLVGLFPDEAKALGAGIKSFFKNL